MVGMTRLELATSRPPAVRATSCATPRFLIPKVPADYCRRLIFPAVWTGGCSQNATTVVNNLKLPNQYDIQENHIRLGVSWDILIIAFSLLRRAEDASKKINKEVD